MAIEEFDEQAMREQGIVKKKKEAPLETKMLE
jgi:hypothetical protein